MTVSPTATVAVELAEDVDPHSVGVEVEVARPGALGQHEVGLYSPMDHNPR